ncbi:MAG: ATP-binding protein [Candidatus Peribacteraceae bacterium]|nr:ATP-binding protein [Candidatus Peribacteraceae bacterium]MDP7453946.1 ATP-binding protein [Candidatus Peribacteraceae bacterium]MDP7645593.1 ATP-binding protein [Candidatus Peribacteraceae bacterium]
MIDEYGWQEHEIFSPVYNHEGSHIGIVGVRYDSRPLLDTLLSIASVGETGEILLGAEKEGELVLLHHRFQPAGSKTLKLGNLEEQAEYGLPLALSVKGKENLGKAADYTGERVYAAYRTLPSLGWGLVVKITREEALEGTMRLAFFLTIIGIFIIISSGIIAHILAGRLTNPIVRLSKEMGKLGPGHWHFNRSARTGDEVELLETVASDMATRLQDTYERMEEIIVDRTQELKKQYETDRAILESIQHGIITVGKTGVIISVNTAAAKLLEKDIVFLIGEKIDDVVKFYKGNEQYRGDDNPIRKSLNSKSIIRFDSIAHLNIEKEDGEHLPVRLSVAPLLDNGDVHGAVAVFQDVAEERRVDYMKSEFITLASHQLRTPLSTFQWYLELLEGTKSNFSEEQKESIKEMRKSGKRMANLIDTLLHAAQLEGGSIEPKIKKIDFTELLEDIAGELQSFAKDAGCPCKIDIPDRKIELQTDPILLHVIVQNFISNAVKYSPNKTPISMQAKVSDAEIEITIKDLGLGIPEADQPRIFERLFRASNVKEMDTTGNGLGLFISKLIAEDMGGEISFKSKEGKGSEFVLRLPIN